jgi:hypothetical protein
MYLAVVMGLTACGGAELESGPRADGRADAVLTQLSGTIYEGAGITGVTLGTTRGEAEAALGAPESCSTGDKPLCIYRSPETYPRYIAVEFNEAATSTAAPVKGRQKLRRPPPPTPSVPAPTGAIYIRVYLPEYVTTQGIHPGSTPSALRAAYGDQLLYLSGDYQNPFLLAHDAEGRVIKTIFNIPDRYNSADSIIIDYPEFAP